MSCRRTALNRCNATDRRWNKNEVSVSSPDTLLILWPRAEIKSEDDELNADLIGCTETGSCVPSSMLGGSIVLRQTGDCSLTNDISSTVSYTRQTVTLDWITVYDAILYSKFQNNVSSNDKICCHGNHKTWQLTTMTSWWRLAVINISGSKCNNQCTSTLALASRIRLRHKELV